MIEHYTIPDSLTNTSYLRYYGGYFEDFESASTFFQKLIRSSNEVERAYAASSPIIFKGSFFDQNKRLVNQLLFDSLLVYNELMKLKPISLEYIERLICCYNMVRENRYQLNRDDEFRKEEIFFNLGENLYSIVKKAEDNANGKDPFTYWSKKEEEEYSLKSLYCHQFLKKRIPFFPLLHYAYENIDIKKYQYGKHKELLREMFDSLKKEDLPKEVSKKVEKEAKANRAFTARQNNKFCEFSCFRVLRFITKKASLTKDYELLNLIVDYLNTYYLGYDVLHKYDELRNVGEASYNDFIVYFDRKSKKYILLNSDNAYKKREKEWEKQRQANREEMEDLARWERHFWDNEVSRSNLPD